MMLRRTQRIEDVPKEKARKRKSGAGAPKGNQNAKANRGGTGRPSRYSPDLIAAVRLMAVGGASDAEIAEAIKISVETLRRWRRDRIEFLNGTRVTDEEMAETARTSLFKLAIGYDVKTERVHFTKDGKATIIKVTEHVPAETKAAIAILQAYDKNQAFAQKREVNNAFSLADLVALSMKDREAKARALAEGKLIEGDVGKVER